ncbi:unnamed protein product [Rotaria sp. Silwood2]|nr:unnamed protein product [Rotaria sp. Silwood2]CAF4020447.1 unnamed protein product [Rotaria sp. Silwood2]
MSSSDSGIGRAVALAFAREDASIVISYLNEDEDAVKIQKAVEESGLFDLVRYAVPHMPKGGEIINVGSIQVYDPSAEILDYATTKAAIVGFTKGLARKLLEKGIHVNCVAPESVWTPLVVASFSKEKNSQFGSNYLIKRPAQARELAPAFVFLACGVDSSYVSGKLLAVTGGEPTV